MSSGSETTAALHLDARGLPPPEPLVRILSLIDRLDPAWNGQIEAWLDRRPLFLFPELEQRGFRYDCEASNGGYVVTIRRSTS